MHFLNITNGLQCDQRLHFLSEVLETTFMKPGFRKILDFLYVGLIEKDSLERVSTINYFCFEFQLNELITLADKRQPFFIIRYIRTYVCTTTLRSILCDKRYTTSLHFFL